MDFIVRNHVMTGSGGNPVPYLMIIRALSLGKKQTEREADFASI
jgi:hypothetical protein